MHGNVFHVSQNPDLGNIWKINQLIHTFWFLYGGDSSKPCNLPWGHHFIWPQRGGDITHVCSWREGTPATSTRPPPAWSHAAIPPSMLLNFGGGPWVHEKKPSSMIECVNLWNVYVLLNMYIRDVWIVEALSVGKDFEYVCVWLPLVVGKGWNLVRKTIKRSVWVDPGQAASGWERKKRARGAATSKTHLDVNLL